MPFETAQSVMKKILPGFIFRWLYRLATAVYNGWTALVDWQYYHASPLLFAIAGDKNGKQRLKTIKSILPYTMVGRRGLLKTYELADAIVSGDKSGAFVECGVARGGCSAMLALVAKGGEIPRDIWLFDSFEGLPEPTEEDVSGAVAEPGTDRHNTDLATGYCLGTYEEVEDLLFFRLKLEKDRIHMVKGWFQDTLPESRGNIGEIALLRLDGDWYESTKCCLENLYPNVISGGYIVIDDYYLEGCEKAVREYLEENGTDVEIKPDKRGGSYFQKP